MKQLLISKLICFASSLCETQQFELVANELLELFPAQPQFYFLFIRIQSAQAI
jgi:hypothetical protein